MDSTSHSFNCLNMASGAQNVGSNLENIVVSVCLKSLNESVANVLFPMDSLISSGAVMSGGGSSWCLQYD